MEHLLEDCSRLRSRLSGEKLPQVRETKALLVKKKKSNLTPDELRRFTVRLASQVVPKNLL